MTKEEAMRLENGVIHAAAVVIAVAVAAPAVAADRMVLMEYFNGTN
jgi:hypothetical protein